MTWTAFWVGLSLDLVEKADELLMPMLLHAASDDLAFEDVEGGKQGGGASNSYKRSYKRYRAELPYVEASGSILRGKRRRKSNKVNGGRRRA